MKSNVKCIQCGEEFTSPRGLDTCDYCVSKRTPVKKECKTCKKYFMDLIGEEECNFCKAGVDGSKISINNIVEEGESTQNDTQDEDFTNLDTEEFPFNVSDFSPKQMQAIVSSSKVIEYNSITEMCEKEGIARKSYYRWLQNPKFVKARNAMIVQYVENSKDIVMSGLLMACSKGNPRAIELWMQYVEKWVPIKEIKNTGEMKHRHFTIKRAIDKKV